MHSYRYVSKFKDLGIQASADEIIAASSMAASYLQEQLQSSTLNDQQHDTTSSQDVPGLGMALALDCTGIGTVAAHASCAERRCKVLALGTHGLVDELRLAVRIAEFFFL